MTFFDEISKNLTGYGKEAARKAKDAAQVLQLKAQIRGEKQKINELYAAIGAVYFKNHRDDSEDEYKIFFPEIESAMVHVAELEKKLSQLDTTEKCPCCGAAVKKGDSFCSKCGTPIQKEEDGTEEQHIAVTEDDFVQEETAKEPAKETTEEKKDGSSRKCGPGDRNRKYDRRRDRTERGAGFRAGRIDYERKKDRTGVRRRRYERYLYGRSAGCIYGKRHYI